MSDHSNIVSTDYRDHTLIDLVVSMSEERRERKYVSEDARELHEIFSVISEFIASIKAPIKEFIDMFLTSLSGEKLGKEVAALYKELKESGMPEDMVKEMVQEFFRRKLEAAPTIASLAKMLKDALGKGELLRRGREIPKEIIKEIAQTKKARREEEGSREGKEE